MKTYKKPWENGYLKVGENGRYLYNGEKPFFWLADTGWLLFQRLDIQEAYQYLRNRKGKGFNVIQTMVLHRVPMENKAGKQPFYDSDLTKVRDEPDGYWQHIDRVLDMAEEMGLYLAMVPAWGDILKCGILNGDNVEAYISFLAHRYADRPNIIWIVGGDLLGSLGLDTWNRMGELLKEMCPRHLVTFHPVTGTTSSLWFHRQPWLDFNMFQSGHSSYRQVEENNPAFISEEQLPFAEDNWKYIAHDLALEPRKPSLDAEPSYENIMKGLKNWGIRHWEAKDVRRYVYWSVFAGGLGITYGHNAIMQMYFDGAGPGSFGVMDYWYEAIHHVGSGQMTHLKNLMESVPFTEGRAAQDLVEGADDEKYNRIAVFAQKEFLFAYTYTGRAISVKPGALSCEKADAYWMNPENGDISFIRQYETCEGACFEPVVRAEAENDWVLVLVNAERDFFL